MAEKLGTRMGVMAVVVLFVASASLVVNSVQAEIYIVTVDGDPVVGYKGSIPGFEATAVFGSKIDTTSEAVKAYSQHLERQHDMLLDELLETDSYKKLYSYRHIINGFAVQMSPEQAEILMKSPGVKHVEKDLKVKRLTTHTPEFLGLPKLVWPSGGGEERAGEGVVIGIIDTGIYPHHPSFAVHNYPHYGPVPGYRGKCEVDTGTSWSFCNGKIVGAQHFASAAIAAGSFNSSLDFASPLDGDGHGSHTAATAAGNYGVPVRMHGFEFGKASGMAPRARIAVYKALYPQFGGFVADVVAAIDQAVEDGVDILNLSVGPNSPSATGKTTFLNPFDVALLSAVKAGVFVVQAAGNGGPFPKSVVSYSPWITSVAAGVDDRSYRNTMRLGNGKNISGIGLAPPTRKDKSYSLVAANDAMLNTSDILFSPSDCQTSEVLNKDLIEGNLLVCGYSYNFVFGGASVKRVAETARNLGAAGFVLVVETVAPGTKFDPVPVGLPGIVIIETEKSSVFIDYYNRSTIRDESGQVTSFGAKATIGNGLTPIFHRRAPQVAVYSSRGPDVKDYSYADADVLKPDILAPGSLIWAAWTPNGTDEANFQGEGFAMISGTSMAAPHIAGIAALIKQKHPDWSPTAIRSALQTTSAVVDHMGKPLQAQHLSDAGLPTLVPATPFDYGSGAVNPKAALDPGLIFDAGYEDYVSFLCSVPGIDKGQVANMTSTACGPTIGRQIDLNTPSIAVSSLFGSQTILRKVTNVAQTETYKISGLMPPDVSLTIKPIVLTVEAGETKSFSVTLSSRFPTGSYSFGDILLEGDKGHRVRIPVAVLAKNPHQ
uniref:TSA: Wollemia nobilis Ref_Wollemi_Transcript_22002_2984 transcribed RNA sequence n=1 Tax=Wollemia nobilis TaxID=56998 RepID=A0A0C9S508_9CONI